MLEDRFSYMKERCTKKCRLLFEVELQGIHTVHIELLLEDRPEIDFHVFLPFCLMISVFDHFYFKYNFVFF